MSGLEEALRRTEYEVARRKLLFGPVAVQTLDAMFHLSYLFVRSGMLDDAEHLRREVMSEHWRLIGSGHPGVIRSMASLAVTWILMGKFNVRQLCEVLVAESIATNGPRHPDSLACKLNLSWIYGKQGRYDHAESLYREVLRDMTRFLGKQDPSRLTVLNNLAFLLMENGSLGKAMAMMESCVEQKKTMLGPDHELTKSSEEALRTWKMRAESAGQNVARVRNIEPIQEELANDQELVGGSRKTPPRENSDRPTI